jgi:hypothetical protein
MADALSARGNLRIADTAILGKRAFIAHRTHTNTLSIALKQQPVSSANSQESTNFPGHSYLSLACNSGLFLHGLSPISLLYHILLT